MQLLEFQAKELFREYGISLLDSISSTNIEDIPVAGKSAERLPRRSCAVAWKGTSSYCLRPGGELVAGSITA